VLADYFPQAMRERFREEINTHALRREIIATLLANGAINRGGSTFIVRLKEETGRSAEDITHAFAAAMGVFKLASYFDTIDAQDNKLDGGRQLQLYLIVQDVLRRQTAWFLRHGSTEGGLSALIERYREGVARLGDAVENIFDEWLIGRFEDATAALATGGVPEELARQFVRLNALSNAPDIILLAMKLGRPEIEVARIYFRAASHFRVDEMRAASELLGQTDYYNRLAVNSTLNAVASAQRAIVEKIYKGAGNAEPDFESWHRQNSIAADRARKSLDEILNGSELTLAKLTVAVAHLRELAE
jgi:glutamate dehydrogenase